MTRLTQLAVGRRSVTLLLAAALFIAGISAWGSLKQELLPDVSFPIVSVVAPYPGVGAADVTEQVTKPIERAVSGVPGVTQLQSTSANSLAFVVAQFDYGVNLDDAVATIEENIRSAALPAGVDPTVGAFNFNAAPVIVASVSADGSTDLARAAESRGPRSSPSSNCFQASPRRTSPAASRSGSSSPSIPFASQRRASPSSRSPACFRRTTSRSPAGSCPSRAGRSRSRRSVASNRSSRSAASSSASAPRRPPRRDPPPRPRCPSPSTCGSSARSRWRASRTAATAGPTASPRSPSR